MYITPPPLALFYINWLLLVIDIDIDIDIVTV
jgi:hypothetical protein